MLFVIGDSHAKALHGQMYDDPYQVERPSGRTWRVLGTGGATAYGLTSTRSRTRAGHRSKEYVDLFMSSDEKVIVAMFGDVDCVEWPDRLLESAQRYRRYMAELARVRGVSAVIPCRTYPRSSIFSINGRSPEEIRSSVSLWNSLIGESIDTYGPLLGPDGFLLPEFCHSPDDPGERHLSAAGNEAVWQTVEKYCLRIRSAF